MSIKGIQAKVANQLTDSDNNYVTVSSAKNSGGRNDYPEYRVNLKNLASVVSQIQSDERLLPSSSGSTYSGIFFVTPNGDDSTAEVNDASFPYATINGAANAAATFAATSSTPPLVYVIEGTFNEHTITRDGVDMYFADETVVYFSNVRIIDDWSYGSGAKFNIYGKGTFATLTANSSPDQDTINLRNASDVYVQAKDIGDILMWSTASNMILEDCIIRQRINIQSNNTLTMRRCTLLSPAFSNNNFTGDLTRHENCVIRLLSDYAFGVTAELWDINDVWNTATITYTDPGVSGSSYLQQYQTGDASNADVVSNYNIVQNRQSFVACVEYVASGTNTTNMEFVNCVFQIEREYCIGIILLQSTNSAGGDQRILFEGCQIRDLTSNNDTLNLLTGKVGTATVEMDADYKSVRGNCAANSTLFSTYVELDGSFQEIGGDGGGGVDITSGTEFLTGRTLDGRPEYGYYQKDFAASSGLNNITFASLGITGAIANDGTWPLKITNLSLGYISATYETYSGSDAREIAAVTYAGAGSTGIFILCDVAGDLSFELTYFKAP